MESYESTNTHAFQLLTEYTLTFDQQSKKFAKKFPIEALRELRKIFAHVGFITRICVKCLDITAWQLFLN